MLLIDLTELKKKKKNEIKNPIEHTERRNQGRAQWQSASAEVTTRNNEEINNSPAARILFQRN